MNDEIEKIDRKIEKDFGTLEKITFVSDLLQKQIEIRNMLDVRSNIVIGFDSALIVGIIVYFKDSLLESPFLWLLLAILITSLFLAILALKPPRRKTQKGQAESLFYHHYIDSMDMEDYRQKIHECLKEETDIYNAYITETYNITRYSNVPRKEYLYSSLKVSIYGIMAIFLLYSVMLVINYMNNFIG